MLCLRSAHACGRSLGVNEQLGLKKIILRKRSWQVGLIIVLGVLLFLVGVRQIWFDPKISLLVSEEGAQWIRFRESFQLPIHWSEQLTTSFRYRLNGEAVPVDAILTVRAMKRAAVYIDNHLIFRSPDDLQQWKVPHNINLSSYSRQDAHELRIDVLNENGPPALLAYCNALGIRSGDQWEASKDGSRWVPALPVDEVLPLSYSRLFPRTDRALIELLPLFLPIFLLTFLLNYQNDRLRPSWIEKVNLSASAVRWWTLGAWLLLAIKNFWELPLDMGMDNKGHLEYIRYVATYGRIPLATEGWQMFQPPLFHLLAAAIYEPFLFLFSLESVIRILKLLPLMCGAAQVEICYRTMTYAYPKKESMRVVGTLLGGLLPMNLYISQSLGNEPLAGMLTAIIILHTFRIFSAPSPPTRETGLILGFLLGLALLTKVTALLIVPPVTLFVFHTIFQKSRSTNESIRSCFRFGATFIGLALIISGWYYLRNWVEMGRFFVGGWDAYRQIAWWQDPGYRTLRQCVTFGESLFYPVFASINGYWDAIYSSLWMDGYVSAYNRPPWNYDFMLSGAWLSLLPTAAIFIGGLIAAVRRRNEPLGRMVRFSVFSVLIYLTAIFYVFLTVPILSSAKASYALGLTPCIALLGTAGLDVLTRRPLLRATVYGLFACWAVGSYAAYLAV